MKIQIKLYIQAVKCDWENEFKVVGKTYEVDQNVHCTVIQLYTQEITVDSPDYSQADLIKKGSESLGKQMEKLNSEHNEKLLLVSEKIKALSPVEAKTA